MAFGTVTSRMGDVFGTTVNLASRLTSIAPKDAVLIDGEFAAALEQYGSVAPPDADGPGLAEALSAAAGMPASGLPVPGLDAGHRFHLQPMWRRPVRGLGLVEPWLLSRRLKPE